MRTLDPTGTKETTMETGIRTLLARGVDLFNQEDYFEAHEIWEDAWRQEKSEQRRFLQGLIQVAAGFVKLQRRQPRGAKALLERGAKNIAEHADAEWGLDLPPLLECVSRWSDVAARMLESGEFDPGKLAPPRLNLSELRDARSAPQQAGPVETTNGQDGARALHALFDEEWEWTLAEFPTYATVVGDARYDDRWPDMSLEAHARRDAHARDMLGRVKAIDRATLPAFEQLNYDLFRRDLELSVEGQQFPDECLPLNQMYGVHHDVADMIQISPRRTPGNFDMLTRRLRAVPRLVEQTIAQMKKGLDTGITPPRVVMEKVPEMIGNQIVDDPSRSPIAMLALSDLPSDLGADAQRTIRDGVLAAVSEAVVPAYRTLHRFFVEQYLPGTRDSIGLTDLPEGEAWYAHQIRVMTTSDLSSEDIHALGLDEVKRIRGEMDATMRQSGFKGSISEFFQFLRTDPRFYFTDKNELLKTYRDIAKRLDPELPKLFRTLPRLPYGVIPVPSYSEKVQTTAYYCPGSNEAGRAGYFYANTYDLGSRPRWEMEALTAHEAVPGHHLQITLAQEMEGLPKFRRFGGNTAFIEGWGLYSESLGEELGLYRDPYSRFGQLTYEIWRAIRLVVDTGMHAKGWSRDQAISFFGENAGKTGHDIEVEVDRYIAWPAQALAYKIGELKIKELRAGAVRTMGDRFDVREFHDLVLGAGPLPLPILERRVKEWAARPPNRGTAI
jgi:uncharacterized protein (DUF885 family)